MSLFIYFTFTVQVLLIYDIKKNVQTFSVQSDYSHCIRLRQNDRGPDERIRNMVSHSIATDV